MKFYNGFTSRESLCNILHSNPVGVSEYAEFDKIGKEVAITWWVSFTSQQHHQRDHAISTPKNPQTKPKVWH